MSSSFRVSLRPAASAQVQAFGIHTPYSQFDPQHRRLREGLIELRALLATGGADPPELGRRIEAIRGGLSAQFAFEERYGSMHWLPAARPSLRPTIDRLRSEHRTMIAQLEHAETALRRDDAADQEIRAVVLSVLECLEHHDLDEYQLLRSALRHLDAPATKVVGG